MWRILQSKTKSIYIILLYNTLAKTQVEGQRNRKPPRYRVGSGTVRFSYSADNYQDKPQLSAISTRRDELNFFKHLFTKNFILPKNLSNTAGTGCLDSVDWNCGIDWTGME